MTARKSHSAQMSKIKNCGLDQYGAEPFEQQQFGVNIPLNRKKFILERVFPVELWTELRRTKRNN